MCEVEVVNVLDLLNDLQLQVVITNITMMIYGVTWFCAGRSRSRRQSITIDRDGDGEFTVSSNGETVTVKQGGDE